MKILNLYGGIGGNRLLWGNEHEITTVELNPEIVAIYQSLFPQDQVIIADAHEYLLEHINDGWDFIWGSPPCPSHSRINTDGNQKPRYPELSLYQEISMLSNNWYKGKWCIENVKPYYTPWIAPTTEIDRHLFWSNFKIPYANFEREKAIKDVCLDRFGFSLKGVTLKSERKDKVLRNLVNPKVGLHILNAAQNILIKSNTKQLEIGL